MVAQRVKNWAMTMSVPDAISWSDEMASDMNDKATATQKEAVAIVFSSRRVGLLMFYFFFLSDLAGSFAGSCSFSAALGASGT